MRNSCSNIEQYRIYVDKFRSTNGTYGIVNVPYVEIREKFHFVSTLL